MKLADTIIELGITQSGLVTSLVKFKGLAEGTQVRESPAPQREASPSWKWKFEFTFAGEEHS
jgi:hypothetical protein